MFQPMMTWPNFKFVRLGSRTYKIDILWLSSYTQDIATFGAPRVLYQVNTDLPKSDLKNMAKATTINRLLWC